MCLRRHRSTTPDEWEGFSNRNLAETDKQCQNSAALRVIVDREHRNALREGFSDCCSGLWEDFCGRKLAETDKQCGNSAALRVIVDGVLQTTCNDMRRQKDETDVALDRRIAKTRDAKEKLEAHLAKVRQPCVGLFPPRDISLTDFSPKRLSLTYFFPSGLYKVE